MFASRFNPGFWIDFFRTMLLLFVACCLPGLLAGGWGGLMAALALSLVLTPVVMLITSRIGAVSGRTCAGRAKELLAMELSNVRCDVGLRNYDEALRHINEILRDHPQEPEVLYLKAQIVWRGFRNQRSAVSCLNKVLANADPQDQYFLWARNLLAELPGGDHPSSL